MHSASCSSPYTAKVRTPTQPPVILTEPSWRSQASEVDEDLVLQELDAMAQVESDDGNGFELFDSTLFGRV